MEQKAIDVLEDNREMSIAANADEVRGAEQRERALDLVLGRHPSLGKFPRPTPERSAVMRAYPAIVTILDYSKGLGHAKQAAGRRLLINRTCGAPPVRCVLRHNVLGNAASLASHFIVEPRTRITA